MELDGKKVAVLVEEDYEDQELWYPYYRLQEAGAEVEFLGAGESTYESQYGYPCDVHYRVDHAIASNYDGVIVPGGYAPDRMRRYHPMVQFVREIGEAGGPCAAICHGGSMLISAGLVEGRRVTSHPSIRVDMENAGATWVDESVVRDGPVITSRSSEDLPGLMREVIGAWE